MLQDDCHGHVDDGYNDKADSRCQSDVSVTIAGGS
jgi:hypothetical protein